MSPGSVSARGTSERESLDGATLAPSLWRSGAGVEWTSRLEHCPRRCHRRRNVVGDLHTFPFPFKLIATSVVVGDGATNVPS